jgi:hypothetical protein
VYSSPSFEERYSSYLFCGHIISLILVSLFCRIAIAQKDREALAQSDVESTKKAIDYVVDVVWFSPEILKVESSNNLYILISGQISRPTSGISVEENEIFYTSQSGEINKVSKKKLLGENIFVLKNDSRYFEIELFVMPGTYQIPFRFEFDDIPGVSYSFAFDVTESEVIIQGQKKQRSLRYSKKNQFWLGGGLNLLRYKQRSVEVGSDVSFTSLQGPTVYAEYLRELSEKWQINFTAEYSPGSASEGSEIQVPEGDYSWKIFMGQASYKFWHGSGYFGRAELKTMSGFQYHIVPFINRLSLSEVSILHNSLVMLTAGIGYSEQISLKWDFDVFMRYQYPLSSGSQFSIDPSFAFDGSIGLVRILTERSRLGIYWFGQWHNYRYQNYDLFLNNEVRGEQDLFFSKFEIRYGFFF